MLGALNHSLASGSASSNLSVGSINGSVLGKVSELEHIASDFTADNVVEDALEGLQYEGSARFEPSIFGRAWAAISNLFSSPATEGPEDFDGEGLVVGVPTPDVDLSFAAYPAATEAEFERGDDGQGSARSKRAVEDESCNLEGAKEPSMPPSAKGGDTGYFDKLLDVAWRKVKLGNSSFVIKNWDQDWRRFFVVEDGRLRPGGYAAVIHLAPKAGVNASAQDDPTSLDGWNVVSRLLPNGYDGGAFALPGGSVFKLPCYPGYKGCYQEGANAFRPRVVLDPGNALIWVLCQSRLKPERLAEGETIDSYAFGGKMVSYILGFDARALSSGASVLIKDPDSMFEGMYRKCPPRIVYKRFVSCEGGTLAAMNVSSSLLVPDQELAKSAPDVDGPYCAQSLPGDFEILTEPRGGRMVRLMFAYPIYTAVKRAAGDDLYCYSVMFWSFWYEMEVKNGVRLDPPSVVSKLEYPKYWIALPGNRASCVKMLGGDSDSALNLRGDIEFSAIVDGVGYLQVSLFSEDGNARFSVDKFCDTCRWQAVDSGYAGSGHIGGGSFVSGQEILGRRLMRLVLNFRRYPIASAAGLRDLMPRFYHYWVLGDPERALSAADYFVGDAWMLDNQGHASMAFVKSDGTFVMRGCEAPDAIPNAESDCLFLSQGLVLCKPPGGAEGQQLKVLGAVFFEPTVGGARQDYCPRPDDDWQPIPHRIEGCPEAGASYDLCFKRRQSVGVQRVSGLVDFRFGQSKFMNKSHYNPAYAMNAAPNFERIMAADVMVSEADLTPSEAVDKPHYQNRSLCGCRVNDTQWLKPIDTLRVPSSRESPIYVGVLTAIIFVSSLVGGYCVASLCSNRCTPVPEPDADGVALAAWYAAEQGGEVSLNIGENAEEAMPSAPAGPADVLRDNVTCTDAVSPEGAHIAVNS